ncbi:MAG: tetratricopeptide repeat protein [Planctomycetota bacterium]
MGRSAAVSSALLVLVVFSLGAWGCLFAPRDRADAAPAFDTEAELVAANAMFAAGDYEGARLVFERAIEVNPELPDGYLGVGDIHRAEGDLVAAETAYAGAAGAAPQSFEAQYKHGLVLQLLSRLSESVGAYMRALEVDPDSFEANLNIATAYLQLGEPRQGVIFATNAVELEPRSGPARVNLAALYASMGSWPDAAREYQFAAELTELTPDLTLTLADAQIRSGDLPSAVLTLEGLAEVSPTPMVFERLGAARFKSRDDAGALEAFAAAIELDPLHYPALNGLGVCRLNDFLRSGRADRDALESALNYLRASLRANPRQPRVKELLTRFG